MQLPANKLTSFVSQKLRYQEQGKREREKLGTELISIDRERERERET